MQLDEPHKAITTGWKAIALDCEIASKCRSLILLFQNVTTSFPATFLKMATDITVSREYLLTLIRRYAADSCGHYW